MTTKINTLEQTVKKAGFGRRGIAKSYIEAFKKELPEGEEVLGVGFDRKILNRIFVTNKRVTVVNSKAFSEFKQSSILIKDLTSVEIKATWKEYKMTIKAGSVEQEIEGLRVGIANELRSLIEFLKDEYKLG